MSERPVGISGRIPLPAAAEETVSIQEHDAHVAIPAHSAPVSFSRMVISTKLAQC